MKKYIIYIALTVISCSSLWAQDPNFSQFYNNPVYYNPGMVAIDNGMKIRANYRNLWTPVPGKFNTAVASVESEVISNVGFGVLAYTDVEGEGKLRVSGANLYYSYRLIDQKNLAFQVGVSGGIVNKTVDWNRFTFSDNYDEVYGNIYTSAFIAPEFNNSTFADFGTGFALRFNQKRKKSNNTIRMFTLTIGGAAHHITKPKDALLGDQARLPIKLNFHTTANLLIGNTIFSPGFMFERQADFQTFTIGGSATIKPFITGFWFRNQSFSMMGKNYDSFIASFGVNIPTTKANTFRITYSFDMTLSKLRSASIGSHEVTLTLDFEHIKLFQNIQSKNRSKRRYRCPPDFKGFN